MQFSNFYPGNEYLDVLALDVYGSDFNKNYYDSLIIYSKGKPIVLGEVGNPPTPELLEQQPNWVYYITWAGMVRNTKKSQYKELLKNPRILSLEDPAYYEIIAPYRKACGLDPLPLKPNKPMDLTGEWIFNEEKSKLDSYGASNLPYKLKIEIDQNKVAIERTIILEYTENLVTKEVLKLDRSEHSSEFWDSSMITTSHLSENMDTLYIDSKILFNRDNRTFEMVTNEIWTLKEEGTELWIHQYSKNFWGERNITMIFDKQPFAGF